MEQTALLLLLLSAILALLASRPKQALTSLFLRHPACIWIAPPLFTAIFGLAAARAGAWNGELELLVLLYTSAPVSCVYVSSRVPGAGRPSRPSALDFCAILLLWLPLEFSAGASLIPRPAQGFLHSVAYGIAILLGLILFACFRTLPGMKYNLPERSKDYWLPLLAFAVTAPVLALGGLVLGFIPPPHAPLQSAGKMISAVGVIFAGTALPEEILFRSLIQNLLMLRFGANVRILFLAAFIFGCAHLNNGPQPLPNWRYMILATIAGVAYGVVFRKASTVLSSAGLHMLVDWTKHFFF